MDQHLETNASRLEFKEVKYEIYRVAWRDIGANKKYFLYFRKLKCKPKFDSWIALLVAKFWFREFQCFGNSVFGILKSEFLLRYSSFRNFCMRNSDFGIFVIGFNFSFLLLLSCFSLDFFLIVWGYNPNHPLPVYSPVRDILSSSSKSF